MTDDVHMAVLCLQLVGGNDGFGREGIGKTIVVALKQSLGNAHR